MFRKRAGKEPPEMPQPRLEDEVGVKEAVIASDTKARGTIQGRNSVRVAGSFEGEISIDGVVWIEKQGEVQGTVRARDMIIEGQMKGDIDSSERIEVRASGRVTGKLRCNKLARGRRGKGAQGPRPGQDHAGSRAVDPQKLGSLCVAS